MCGPAIYMELVEAGTGPIAGVFPTLIFVSGRRPGGVFLKSIPVAVTVIVGPIEAPFRRFEGCRSADLPHRNTATPNAERSIQDRVLRGSEPTLSPIRPTPFG